MSTQCRVIRLSRSSYENSQHRSPSWDCRFESCHWGFFWTLAVTGGRGSDGGRCRSCGREGGGLGEGGGSGGRSETGGEDSRECGGRGRICEVAWRACRRVLISTLQRLSGGRRRSRRSGRKTEVEEVTVPHATVPPCIDLSYINRHTLAPRVAPLPILPPLLPYGLLLTSSRICSSHPLVHLPHHSRCDHGLMTTAA